MSTTYRGYLITHNPPPIPIRDFDYAFAHRDWDLGDPRYGHARSVDEAKRMIDEIKGGTVAGGRMADVKSDNPGDAAVPSDN